MQPIAPWRRNRTKFSLHPTLDCPRLTTRSHAMRLFPQFGHKTCVPRATWWRCDSCEYECVNECTLCTHHNRHHAALGTQSTIFTSIYNYGWNTGPSLDTWDEGTVKTMDWKERIGSKRGENSFICWQPSKKVGIEWHWNVKIWRDTKSRMELLNAF